jgi:hypothetical protein
MAVVACAVMSALTSGPSIAAGSKKAIDPKADEMLRQMSDFLAGLKSFTVTGFSVDEDKLAAGEKIQRTADSEIAVQCPDRLRAKPVGAGEGLGLWYDGKTMTIACKGNNTFTTLPAPPTLDGAIETLHKQFKVDAPGADLLYSRTYDILLEQVNSGRFIGRETIAGVPANHLAFQGDDVDWQIWIQDGPQPVPLRFVITTKVVKDRPEFALQLSNWQTRATLADATFQFQPPAGASAVKSVAASCAAR